MHMYRATGSDRTGCKISVKTTSDVSSRGHVEHCSIKDTDEAREELVNELVSMFNDGCLVFDHRNLVNVFNVEQVRSVEVEFGKELNVW